MRDKNQSFIQFSKNIETFVSRRLASYEHQFLTTAVAIDPTFLEDFVIIYPRKFSEMVGFVVTHHYLPEVPRWRIYLDLVEMSFSHYNQRQKLILQILLASKHDMLRFLYETDRYSSHELFGIIGSATTNLPKLVSKDRKITKPKRKRGYDDKGSRRPDDRWLPSHDWSFNKLQTEIDFNNLNQQRILDRILSFLRELD